MFRQPYLRKQTTNMVYLWSLVVNEDREHVLALTANEAIDLIKG